MYGTPTHLLAYLFVSRQFFKYFFMGFGESLLALTSEGVVNVSS